MHYILKPLVDELCMGYHGVKMSTRNNPEGVTVSFALGLLCCDLPSQRKNNGTLSYLAKKNCARCRRVFRLLPGTKRIDFSGKVDVELIKNDKKKLVDQQAEEWTKCKSEAERKKVGKRTGIRYSELRRLPYFDIVQNSATDLLHLGR